MTLHRGRQLDRTQVSGIIHLVSSSVPNLPVKNIALVDQEGNLLSQNGQDTQLDPNQMQYVQQIERSFVERIEAILAPIVGRDNVRAEVTAQVDFSEIEETSEKFRPNGSPNLASIRSQQTLEQQGRSGGDTNAMGVPGALSNQPPGAAAAPITVPAASGASVAEGAGGAPVRREATTNYEVDKTIQHVKQAVGNVKRLSAAVVVNHKPVTDAQGKTTFAPLSAQEMAQINGLVRQAVGYNGQRGDTVNVVNAAFASSRLPDEGALPDRAVAYLKANVTDVVKMVLIALALLYLLFFVVRPLMKDMSRSRETARMINLEAAEQGEGEAFRVADAARTAETEESEARLSAFADLLQQAKELARNDPRMVATILREWMAGEDEVAGADANKKS